MRSLKRAQDQEKTSPTVNGMPPDIGASGGRYVGGLGGRKGCRDRGRRAAEKGPSSEARRNRSRTNRCQSRWPRLDLEVSIDQLGRSSSGKTSRVKTPLSRRRARTRCASQERGGGGALKEPRASVRGPDPPGRRDRGRGGRRPAAGAGPVRLPRYGRRDLALTVVEQVGHQDHQRSLAAALFQLDESAIITGLDHFGKDVVNAVHQPVDPPRAAAGET